MEARGRNGWFKATRCSVCITRNLEDTAVEARISFYSRQRGDMPPIMLIGTRQEMETMLVKILHALHRHIDDGAEAVELLGIKVLDHVIVAGDRYLSFLEQKIGGF